MTSALPLLVFSDLDGTLLDHQTYRWEAAQPALDALNDCGAGVVLASSKTAVEIQKLQSEMGLNRWPAIVENGAGVIWASESGAFDTSAYDRLRNLVTSLPAGFDGFGDMTDQDVADVTGLALPDAHNARQRCFSEPGLWRGSDEELQLFLASAAELGIHARQGGRFLTLSFGRTKADAMAEVVTQLAPDTTIALGDAPNDMEMLAAADHGVLVANPSAPPMPQLDTQSNLIRTTEHGPMGWNSAILTLLNDLNLTKGTTAHG